jgi:hypothetical protein
VPNGAADKPRKARKPQDFSPEVGALLSGQARNHQARSLGGLSGQGELKSPSDHTGYGQVFVKLLPSERGSGDFYLNFFKLVLRGLIENLKPIRRESHYPSIS